MDPRILVTTFVFGSVAFATLAVILGGELLGLWRERKKVTGRLEDVVVFERAVTDEDGARLLKKTRDGTGGLVSLERVPWAPDVELLMEQAGGGSLQVFAAATVGLMVLGGLTGFVLFGSTPLAIAGALIGCVLPLSYFRLKRRRRLRAFEQVLPEAIDLMTRAVRAGHPFTAGMGMVADEAPQPVSDEFQRLFDEIRFGLPVEEALVALTERIDLVDTRMFATAILVQREVGGNLAEILDNLAATIRARFSIRRQLRVITAQGRLSGYILSVLPIVVGLGLFTLSPNYIEPLIDSPAGNALIIGGLFAQIVGYLWIRRIVNIEI